MAVATAEAPVTGQTPKSIDVADVLMHDVVESAGIPVAKECGRPIAPFRHPYKGRVWDHWGYKWVEGNRLECLVISGDSGAREVIHLVNDPSEPHGWRTSRPFPGRRPTHIAVLRHGGGLLCVMIEDGKLLWSSHRSDDTWTEPIGYGSAGDGCNGLDVGYVRDRPLVVVARESRGPYCFTLNQYGGWVESGAPAMRRWSLMSALPYGEKTYAVSAFLDEENRRRVYFDWTEFGGWEPRGPQCADAEKDIAEVLAVRGNDVLLLNADGTLATLVGTCRLYVPISVRQLGSAVPAECRFDRVVSRTCKEKAGEFWDLYAHDTEQRLWVIRQDRSEPRGEDGHPNFCPPVPVDTGVGDMDVSHDMWEESLLFSYGAQDRRLRLEVQDMRTRMWREVDVLPPTGGVLLEKTVHRVEAVVRDQRGAPVPHAEVGISAPEGAADCEIYWRDPRPASKQTHPRMLTVTHGGATVYADDAGRVVFTLSAGGGLTARELDLKAGSFIVTARPGQKVLSYLKGTGTLRETDPRGPLPQFDEGGEALKHLNSEAEEQTRKDAAHWMRQAAAAGLGTEPQGIVTVAAPEEGDGAEAQGWWDSFTHWAGDVWRSVSRGVATAAKWVVQESQVVLDGVKWLGQEFVKGGKLVIAGIQQACHAVVTLFQKIVDTVGKAIEWLKALLDFPAMWRTKCAFTEGMDLAFGQAQKQVTGMKQAADTWLDNERDALRRAVKQARSTYGHHPLSTGTGPGSEGGKLREHTQDPTANWLYDKVRATPPGELQLGGHSALETAWNDFRQNLDSFTNDGKKIGNDLLALGGDLITNPSSDKTVGDLLGLAGDIEDALLVVIKGFVDGVADLVDVGIGALDDVLRAELPVPDGLRTLWRWVVAAGGGDPDNEPLNLANLIALLAAVPVTVVYKLAHGNAEPFPGGTLPELNSLDADGGSDAAKLCLFVSGLLTAFSVLPAVASDWMGDATPTWLSAGSLVLTVLTLGLANYEYVKGAVSVLRDPVAAICAAHVVEFVICVVLVSLSRIQAAYELVKRFTPWLTTGLGVLGLLYYGYKAGRNAFPNVATTASGALATLSPCTAFLNSESFRESEYALPAKLAVDTIGLVGSGTLVAVNASPLAGE
ncbi:Ig-like domain-containing protein [Streptomyces sp. HNM0574]|uniref:Ig-like domain-containing protein n=1 Tax=Streptomyces sp. HNM0574 TaxID=2714954 RepID=UPI00146ACF27|nr:Ig-like domain-containing protein [Streptomyces sp. HNM0574]NLU66687.1 hypothetical protein [Streptomyces sp. HNM0574]